jgi:hypothetical protein
MMQPLTPFDADPIAPRLWMGAAPPLGGVLASRGFDILILCAREYQPPEEWFPGVAVGRVLLNDDGKTPFSATDALAAYRCAADIARAVKMGAMALVTCWEGRNRSGLVTALAIAQLTGCSGADAMRAVRFRRKPRRGPPLMNQQFADALAAMPAAVIRGNVTRQNAMAAGLAG